MFNFFRRSIETSLFEVVWPSLQHLQVAIPEDHPAMRYPMPLQASTATANLAICAMLLFQNLPAAEATQTVRRLEALQFERIREDKLFYQVGDVLVLPIEQRSWRREAAGMDVNVQSNLDTIFRTVHGDRLAEYQADCRRGLEALAKSGGRVVGYGPMGFLAKRWISHISGQPVFEDENLLESGFEDLGLSSFYFSNVLNVVAQKLGR